MNNKCHCNSQLRTPDELHSVLEQQTKHSWFPRTAMGVNKALSGLPVEDYRKVVGSILEKELPNIEVYMGPANMTPEKLLFCVRMMTKQDYFPVTSSVTVSTETIIARVDEFDVIYPCSTLFRHKFSAISTLVHG